MSLIDLVARSASREELVELLRGTEEQRQVAEKAACDIEYLTALMRERDAIDGTAIWDRDPEAIEDFRTRWNAALANVIISEPSSSSNQPES